MSYSPTVALAGCASYEQADVDAAVEEAVQSVGGMGAFVAPGQRVLVKPNLLMPRAPEDAVTTHPAVVEAVLKLVNAAGGQPIVGDSPGLISQGIENVWSTTGMAEVCARQGAELVSFETAGVERKTIRGRDVHVAKVVADADVVISVPKLKTHTITVLTCAVKNTYGCLPGMSKADWHSKLPKPSTFQALMVDVFEAVRPALSIVDAVVGMEGDGPSAGRPKPLGFVAAGQDAVALDMVCGEICGLKPPRMLYLKLAAERGLGVADLAAIRVAGSTVDELRPAEFLPARTTVLRYVPEFLLNLVSHFVWVRPGFGDACERCGKCIEKCPADALVMGDDRPVLDKAKCIECFCCHEICPESAVFVDLSFVAKFFAR